MYLTVKETAEYLSLPADFIKRLIQQKRIRALYDGEQYLIFKDQFNEHLEQIIKWKERWEAENNEPILEDWDVKDED